MEMSLTEAAERIGRSEKTVRRLIEQGKITAVKRKGVWVITDLGERTPELGEGTTALIRRLESEVDYLRKENDQLRAELTESRIRSDTIILQLAEHRSLLEYSRRPFWRRWGRRKPAQTAESPADQGSAQGSA